MKIVVHRIEAEITRARNPRERIHVGAVAIDETAARMHQSHHLCNVLLEQPERIGIGHHDAGNGVIAGDAYRVEVDVAAGVRR